MTAELPKFTAGKRVTLIQWGIMTPIEAPSDTYELVPLGSPVGMYNLTELRKIRDARKASGRYIPKPTDMAASMLPWRTRGGPH